MKRRGLGVLFVLATGVGIFSCGEGGEPRLDTGSRGAEEPPALERIRSRQNLRFTEDGESREIPLEFGSLQDPEAGIPPVLADLLEWHCSEFTLVDACPAAHADLSRLSCGANLLLEIARAVDTIELAPRTNWSLPTEGDGFPEVSIPPQSRAVRAALSEAAVRWLVTGFNAAAPAPGVLNDSSCELELEGETYETLIRGDLVELYEVVLEAAELARVQVSG